MTGFVGKSQVDLSAYKYVVIPKKFSDFKTENQYGTSTLVKYLFSQKGFNTIYEDNLPEELIGDRCLGLFTDLRDESSMFTTKTTMLLRDCRGEEVLVSKLGKSKKKDFKDAFNEAISNAFNSFGALEYSLYAPKNTEAPVTTVSVENEDKTVTVSFKNDIKSVDENQLPVAQRDTLIEQVATRDVQYFKDRTPVPSNFEKADALETEAVEQIATEEEQSYVSKAPVPSEYKKRAAEVKRIPTGEKTEGMLYAQEVINGYQLVDSTPKIQLNLYKSQMPNVYVAKAKNKDGVVYTSDGKWFFEYYQNGNMVVEELNIKF